jgi:hypothetical protein
LSLFYKIDSVANTKGRFPFIDHGDIIEEDSGYFVYIKEEIPTFKWYTSFFIFSDSFSYCFLTEKDRERIRINYKKCDWVTGCGPDTAFLPKMKIGKWKFKVNIYPFSFFDTKGNDEILLDDFSIIKIKFNSHLSYFDGKTKNLDLIYVD